MSILKFLGMNVDHPGHGIPTAETETVRKIVQKLDQLPEQQARYIAAFAFLLSRAARADLQISADETALMERIVMQQSGLPEELALFGRSDGQDSEPTLRQHGELPRHTGIRTYRH